MTRREKILKFLIGRELSCANICDYIAEEEDFSHANHKNFSHYMSNLNASVSGTLNSMVRRAEIEIGPNKGPRGGKIYKLIKI